MLKIDLTVFNSSFKMTMDLNQVHPVFLQNETLIHFSGMCANHILYHSMLQIHTFHFFDTCFYAKGQYLLLLNLKSFFTNSLPLVYTVVKRYMFLRKRSIFTFTKFEKFLHKFTPTRLHSC